MRSKALGLLLACLPLAAQVSVTTDHIDNTRENWNAAETALTPANVVTGKFGLIGSYSVDGALYAQPLTVNGVTIGGTVYNLLIVATMNNTIYAFNADLPGHAPLWSVNFGAPNSIAAGPLTGNYAIGCVSTPVIDVAHSRIFAACDQSDENWTLRCLSLTTGAILASKTVIGQVIGTGYTGTFGTDPTSGPYLLFNPPRELQRQGLTLANGNVYFSFGSYGDEPPWHGWAFAYTADTSLTQVGVFCTSPNTQGAGLWGSGGAFSVDGSGNLYVATGNGVYDGITAFAESILKFSPTLALLDWFTPSNYAAMDSTDSDMSSSRAMLIPGTTLIVLGAKDFRGFKIDTTCMGHLQGSTPTCSGIAAQLWLTNPSPTITDHSGVYGGLYYNGSVYLPNTGGSIYGYTITGTTVNTSPFVVSAATYEFPGAAMTASSNGTSNGIVWAVTTATSALFSSTAGTLRALNPTTLADVWDSDMAARDTLGTFSKYNAPTVANGRVYVATQDSKVQVYGLIQSASMRSGAIRGSADIR